MAISIQYQNTRREYLEALKATRARVKRERSRSPRRERVVLFIFAGFLLLVAAIAVIGGKNAQQSPQHTRGIRDGSLWIVVTTYVVVYIFMKIRQRFDKSVDVTIYNLSADPRTLTISDEKGRFEYNWSAFVAYDETANLLILYIRYYWQAEMLAPLFIPKRAFEPAALAEFRALLELKVCPKAIGFPVLPISMTPTSTEPASS